VPARRSAPAPDRNERYRLEDFEVGESNRLAYAAAVRLTEPECPRSASPLFIHGMCGVGKTHLLQAVVLRMRELGKGASAIYTTAEAFMNEFVVALRAGKIDSFRKRYRGLDLLCVDDVQFLNGKTGTQNELLHTFDAIDLSGSRVMLASDEHPRRVERLSQALVSRFMAGMVVKIDPPEAPLRARIVAKVAAKRGLQLDAASAGLIASRCTGPAPTARDIEGVLTRIEALRLLPGQNSSDGTIGLVLIRRAMGLSEGDAPGPSRPVRPVRMTHIIDEVCRALRVETSELFGKGRHKRVVLARSMCATLGRSLTTMSYPEIARSLGRPNHSTVITAVKRLERQMSGDATSSVGLYLGNDLDGLAAELGGMNLRTLAEQLRNDILRTAPGT
jgi:chromosomal replication initiator protein